MSLKVFVCGATGTQGGNVARHLLQSSVPVHFLARDPSSDKAKSLVSLGAALFPGSYDDADALSAAMVGCTGLFINLMPSFTDVTQELRHAKAIMSTAKDCGVKRVVYSSVLGIYEMPKMGFWEPGSMVSQYFDSKIQVSNEVQSAGFESWSIIRPGKFMGDFLQRSAMLFPGLADKGVLTTALRKHDRIPLTDPYVIGAFGAAALMQPERFGGKEVDVLCEMVTCEELVVQIAKVTGREMRVDFLSDEELAKRTGDLFLEAQRIMRDSDTYVDLDTAKAWGIPLTTFEQFLQREKESVEDIYGTLA